MFVLVGQYALQHGTQAHPGLMPNVAFPVIVDRPIPNRHLQMAFVERKQEVETFTTVYRKSGRKPFSHRCNRSAVHSQSIPFRIVPTKSRSHVNGRLFVPVGRAVGKLLRSTVQVCRTLILTGAPVWNPQLSAEIP